MRGSMEMEELAPRGPAPHKRSGGPLRMLTCGDPFSMLLGMACTLVSLTVGFGLAILVGAVDMSPLAGLAFTFLPCVCIGWHACGPLPCDRDETMRRMKFG